MGKEPRKEVPNPEDLIPAEQVIADMMDPDGGFAAQAARSYYYLYYASDRERERMDHHDTMMQRVSLVVVAFIMITFIGCVLGLLRCA